MLVLVRAIPLFVLLAALYGCSGNQKSEPVRAQQAPPPAAAPAPAQTPTTTSSAPDSRKVLAVFGDSISAGFGLEPGQSFPDDLQKKLDMQGYPWRVVNLGISGDTTEGGVSRMDSATRLMPAIVLLELGGNDGLRGLPLDSTRMNLDLMIQTFEHTGAKVVLAGMTLPPNYGTAFIHNFEGVYKDLASHYHLPFIPFLMSDMVTQDLRYFQPDHIHPTAQGAEIVSGTVFRTLKPLLGATAAKAHAE